MVLTWLTSFLFRAFTGSFLADSLAGLLPLSGLDLLGSDDSLITCSMITDGCDIFGRHAAHGKKRVRKMEAE
jgi:hypothetical protein